MNKPDASELACQIQTLLKQFDQTTADEAINFVWFYRVGQYYDWSRVKLRKLSKKRKFD